MHKHCPACKEEVSYEKGTYGTTCSNCGQWVLCNNHEKDKIKFIPRRSEAFIKRFKLNHINGVPSP